MVVIIKISLENEMDLILANKRCMKVAELLGLTIATQTTFATAVSEIARTVIDITNNGELDIGVVQKGQRHELAALVTFNSDLTLGKADEGVYYAQRLVPQFEMVRDGNLCRIEMKIGLPRSLNTNKVKLDYLKNYFKQEVPATPYEEIKRKNVALNQITAEQEEEIKRSKFIDDKKNEFISIASHELKTPLTVIKAYTQMALKAKDECSERVRQYLVKIDSQSAKLHDLVKQLLDISKAENGKLDYNMQTVSLDEFIAEMVSIMQNITPGHQLEFSVCSGVNISVDSLRMEQVFSNLISNAAKYSAKNTVINIVCTLSADKKNVTIAVSDQGIGMSEESIKSIFNKFYRAETVSNNYAGLGMGLYITAQIIKDHRGKIWAESEIHNGSVFYISLPCTVSR
ncbi:histidine kinase [Mucilaginibacter paludis DSM 18603]|uniref:histidine kinase n=2 Tax=Mucilaginibacter TaxID=423349 RepID=H1YEX5_9SPHI|nr:histidine kinase [Mucilaginibacter paludis DSM 18603]